MRGTATVDDDAATVKRADFPMLIFIKQPIGSTVGDINYNAVFVGDLDLALGVLKHLAAFADVVSNVAVLGRGRGLCGNERQRMCRSDDLGLLIRADRAGTLHNTVLGTGGHLCDDPFAERMRALVYDVAARADCAYLLVTAVIAGILYINMGVLCAGVFGIPVVAPLVALDAVSVFATRKCAVAFAALFAESAMFANVSAFGACREALGANICAIFADIAVVAHENAVFAIAVTLVAEIYAILTAGTVKAQFGTI